MAKIFCCTAGRTGSKHLSEAINYLVPYMPCFHEPRPWGVGKTVEDVNNADPIPKETSYVLYEKIRRIMGASQYGHFCETSQMFIKAFVETVLLNFRDVYCVYLHRDRQNVLLSYYRKCLHKELDWFLQPHWRANILRKEGNFSFMDIVEWNIDEVKARFDYYRPRFVKTWDFDFKDINNLDEYYRMFDHFGIAYNKVDRLPDYLKKYRNSLVASEIKYLGNTKKKIAGEMKKNWHLPPMKGWRFPSDYNQLFRQG